jgi:hypothetical protein
MLIPLLSPDRAVDVCFAIRDPARLLSSAFGQVMMGGDVVTPEVFKAESSLGAVNWVDVITRLRATPGVNQLTVWRCEDYTAMFPQICDPLLGSCDVAVTPLPDAAHCGMSCMAVARTLEAAAQGTPAPAAVRQALPVDPGNPP